MTADDPVFLFCTSVDELVQDNERLESIAILATSQASERLGQIQQLSALMQQLLAAGCPGMQIMQPVVESICEVVVYQAATDAALLATLIRRSPAGPESYH
jgi:hypothetical protein